MIRNIKDFIRDWKFREANGKKLQAEGRQTSGKRKGADFAKKTA